MIERRAHWDEELIFAVMSAAGDGGHLFIDDIHAIIAAVEDWEARRGYVSSAVYHGHIDYLQAAIRRVRELCDQRDAEVADMDAFYRQVVLVPVDEVRRALDGEQ